MQQIYQQQMETHASDEISKEQQRRQQQQQQHPAVTDVDGLEDGVAGIDLEGGGDGVDDDDDGALAAAGNVVDEDEVDDEEEEDDCDYRPEDYHDENSKHRNA